MLPTPTLDIAKIYARQPPSLVSSNMESISETSPETPRRSSDASLLTPSSIATDTPSNRLNITPRDRSTTRLAKAHHLYHSQMQLKMPIKAGTQSHRNSFMFNNNNRMRSGSKNRPKLPPNLMRPKSIRGRAMQSKAMAPSPYHATLKSMANINSPYMIGQLSNISNDLKLQRENKKLSAELTQKNEDYKYAVEIGENLTEENNSLQLQIEQEIAFKKAMETVLNEKISLLQDIITEYTQKCKDLESKNEILESQNKYHQK